MTNPTFRPNIVAASDKQAEYAARVAQQWVQAFDEAVAGYMSVSDDDLAADGFTRVGLEAKIAEAVARFERPIEAKSYIELSVARVAIIDAVFCNLFGMPHTLDLMAPTYARNMGLV